jgi:hypothetical protein
MRRSDISHFLAALEAALSKAVRVNTRVVHRDRAAEALGRLEMAQN